MVHATSALRAAFAVELDQYGDPFWRESTIDDLRETFANMTSPTTSTTTTLSQRAKRRFEQLLWRERPPWHGLLRNYVLFIDRYVALPLDVSDNNDVDDDGGGNDGGGSATTTTTRKRARAAQLDDVNKSDKVVNDNDNDDDDDDEDNEIENENNVDDDDDNNELRQQEIDTHAMIAMSR